jgi:hypothetical protein
MPCSFQKETFVRGQEEIFLKGWAAQEHNGFSLLVWWGLEEKEVAIAVCQTSSSAQVASPQSRYPPPKRPGIIQIKNVLTTGPKHYSPFDRTDLSPFVRTTTAVSPRITRTFSALLSFAWGFIRKSDDFHVLFSSSQVG